MGKDALIIVNLSGRGDKDVAQVADEGEVGNAEVISTKQEASNAT